MAEDDVFPFPHHISLHSVTSSLRCRRPPRQRLCGFVYMVHCFSSPGWPLRSTDKEILTADSCKIIKMIQMGWFPSPWLALPWVCGKYKVPLVCSQCPPASLALGFHSCPAHIVYEVLPSCIRCVSWEQSSQKSTFKLRSRRD